MTRLVSVAELTTYVRVLFEADELLQDVAVEGEVTQTFTSRAGHVYFTLSDGTVNLKCVMFRGQVARARARIETGVTVAAFGRVSVYDRDATYQLYVDAVFDSGIGLQAMELERLRQRLADEGLFDPTRKRDLPPIPKVIGVVTSLQGAVWHDIQTVVERRYPLAELLLSPAQVQGANAEASLVLALRLLVEGGRPDVIIVARGGGSADDLAAFNGELLARAVFASPVPVVSAIGHETDWSILDDVADLRAPTPTAAAELVTPNALDLQRSVLQSRLRIEASMMSTLDERRAVTSSLTVRVRAAAPLTAEQTLLEQRELVLVTVGRSLRERIGTEVAAGQSSRRLVLARRADVGERRRYEVVLPLNLRLGAAAGVERRRRRTEVASLLSGLEQLNPTAILERGYAVATDDRGKVIARVADGVVGQSINLTMADGELRSTVTAVAPR